MTILYITALIIASVVILRNAITSKIRSQIEEHYIKVLLFGDPQSERYITEITRLSRDHTKLIIAETFAKLTPYIYRLDQQWVESTISKLNLGDFMMSKISKSRGYAQAHHLATLSLLPLPYFDSKQLEPYTTSTNRMVRFFTLLAMINTDNDNALKHIAAYPTPFTAFEVQQLLAVLCRGSVAVAYQPLLNHCNTNVKMLGIAVVEHFEITTAEPELREIISSSESYSLRREALYALSSMQILLCTPAIYKFVISMPSVDKRRFLRYAAESGYSQSVINFFLRLDEQQYFDSLINSYKIKIECF